MPNVVLRETVVVGDTVLRIELHDDLRYCLRYGDRVEYSNGRRRVHGHVAAYTFRSVEQLRYDFEEDVRRLAEGA